MVLGGQQMSSKAVSTFCKKTSWNSNDMLCEGGENDKFTWSWFHTLNEGRNGHSCTIFDHPVHGLSVLVTNGDKNHSTEIFLVKNCSQCQSDSDCDKVCSWSYDLNGKPIQWIGLYSLIDSAIVTLNGIPTIF